MKSKVCCIVAAGGSGKRMGSTQNKLFLELDGVPVIAHTLSNLQASPVVDEIIISAREEDFLYLRDIVERFLISKVKKIVKGGATRGESVLSAKAEISADAEIVMIHDGARPFVSDEIINNTVDAAKIHSAAACGVKPKCTLKATENGFIKDTINRDTTVEIQTPQVFKKEVFDKMYSFDTETIKSATDDCILAEKAGAKIFITEGSYKNIKITTPEDLEVAESFLRRVLKMDIRVGHGFDVHAFSDNRRLILCGVDIDYEKGLLGHSDADVATHAVMDALLGAAAKGDIGKHFPDSDESYKDADSLKLLEKVVAIIKEDGFDISNIDVTIIAQKPKLLPYIEKMRDNLANVVKIDKERVNVKATTTEKLGFTGRGEGIATEAVCLIAK